MSVFVRVKPIPVFMAYPFHYFYNLKTKCDRQKPIKDLESTSINTSIKIIINAINETKSKFLLLRLGRFNITT